MRIPKNLLLAVVAVVSIGFLTVQVRKLQPDPARQRLQDPVPRGDKSLPDAVVRKPPPSSGRIVDDSQLQQSDPEPVAPRPVPISVEKPRTTPARKPARTPQKLGLRPIWPQPNVLRESEGAVASVLSANTKISLPLDADTWEVYRNWIFKGSSGATCDDESIGELSATANDEAAFIPDGANEAYTMRITSDSITINSPSRFGVMHALKTLAQLVQWQGGCGYIAGTPMDIEDAPRLPHRGLLIDPPRAFITLQEVLATIDRLSLLKLNVLHLRLTDDTSFVVRSQKYPDLSRGEHTYSVPDIRTIVIYAARRGVRVIPEVDVPGHAHAWGKGGFPNLVAHCPSVFWSIGLDPTIPFMWEVLEGFLEEMMELFPDPLFHLGGDEVSLSCYDQDHALMERARQQGMGSNSAELLKYFTDRFHRLLASHPVFSKRTIVLWEDLYENHKNGEMDMFRKDKTIFQTWISTKNMEEVARLGFRSLLSTGFYFDVMHDGKRPYSFDVEFDRIYHADPFNLNFFENRWRWETSTQHFFSGVEACIWENAYSSYETKVWPLLPVFAESFWTATESKNLDSAKRRLPVMQEWMVAVGVEDAHKLENHEHHAKGHDAVPDFARLRMGMPEAERPHR